MKRYWLELVAVLVLVLCVGGVLWTGLNDTRITPESKYVAPDLVVQSETMYSDEDVGVETENPYSSFSLTGGGTAPTIEFNRYDIVVDGKSANCSCEVCVAIMHWCGAYEQDRYERSLAK